MAICVFLNFVEMWKSLQTIPVLPIPEILMPKSATKSKVATVYKPFFGLYFLEYWMLVCVRCFNKTFLNDSRSIEKKSVFVNFIHGYFKSLVGFVFYM